jgi:hypothetical protein
MCVCVRERMCVYERVMALYHWCSSYNLEFN